MIKATEALFIKLGPQGAWAEECIREGMLRLGYRETSHTDCLSGRWGKVRTQLSKIARSASAATNHLNQVKRFYTAPQSTLWITFHADSLWWCFAEEPVSILSDGTKTRAVVGQRWRSADVKQRQLSKTLLSGKLLATEGFQGTICSVRELSYLVSKINGNTRKDVEKALSAQKALVDALEPIVQGLHPKDLETLTDLIFRNSGWNRVGVAGGTTKDIDLDLISALTSERLAVQVKSRATAAIYRNYRLRFADMQGYTRFYFVSHSPDPQLLRIAEQESDEAYVFWGVAALAKQAARSGLTGWLLDKGS